jgi:hypothetical protein
MRKKLTAKNMFSASGNLTYMKYLILMIPDKQRANIIVRIRLCSLVPLSRKLTTKVFSINTVYNLINF